MASRPRELVRRVARKARARIRPTIEPTPVADTVAKVKDLRDHREWDEALAVLDAALAERPQAIRLHVSRAQLLAARGHWEQARSVWEDLIALRGPDLSGQHWAQAVASNRMVGDLDGARGVLDRVPEVRQAHPAIIRQRAEIAMASAQWDAATDLWAAYFDERHAAFPGLRFPRRPSTSDWFEAAWHEVALSLTRRGLPHQRPFTPAFYRAVAQVLDDAGLAHDAIALLAGLVEVMPQDASDDLLAVRHRLTALRSITREELPTTIDPEHAATLDALPPLPAAWDGLGPLRVLRVPAGSSVETALRSTRYLNQSCLDRFVERLEAADGWPDAALGRDPLVDAAREWSDRYGEQYAVEPHLPASTLSDAIFLSMYHEASQLRPMERLADDLAAASTDAPVVIEIPSMMVNYLVDPSAAAFSLYYLYFALLERKVNAFLCFYEREPIEEEAQTVAFQSRWRMAQKGTRLEPRPPAPGEPGADVALVPAGIRSFPLLVAQHPGATVYESGMVVGELAYDRRASRTQVVAAHAPLHPKGYQLPTFEFPLTRIAVLPGTDSLSAAAAPLDAVLEQSEPLGDGWAAWLHRATAPFLEHMAWTAHKDVARRGIREAHVADYLLPEGVIVGDAVRRAGGRVVLHPHSSNPVHLQARRADTFDEVEAVTATGVEMWREQFPEHVVRHVPASVITPGPARPFVADAPLSVVIFGGMATMGRTPWIDLDRHAQSYRDLFAGFEELQRQQPIDIYFKPRGPAGDTEHWLFRTVGRTAAWQPVYIHGRRLDLPNQVFVSVSVGTTALLEGIAGGTPGFVVRDFPVRDYTTLDADAFPTLTVPDALDLLRDLATAEGYDGLLQRERAWARTELDLD
ncbi:tetratricopeptide repeat protein [Nocardioides sp. LML1-1-1.1]|uniref:tetratricopeptide repeat protein n=1 Tax=Nocardioides sp. LML1-1-1.1 TaxID=3135248 RepID=UPI003427047B